MTHDNHTHLHQASEGIALDALVNTKRTLEREREGLLEQAALRRRAIDKVNEVIATLRGLQLDDSVAQVTAAPPGRPRRTAISDDDIRAWTLEFALAQTRPFSTGDVGRWMISSNRLAEGADIRGSLSKRVALVLADDGRFSIEGTGPARRFVRRQTIVAA